jgi:hypothetical protein
MQVLAVLSEIGRLEAEVGEFYAWLSDVFADDVEAAGFFYRLSMQERSHVNLVNFAKKLIHRSPQDFAAVDLDPASIDDLRAMIGSFRKHNPKPPLAEVLEMAVKIEGHHAERILRSAVIQSNPRIADLVNSLAVADSEHVDLIKGFLRLRTGQ